MTRLADRAVGRETATGLDLNIALEETVGVQQRPES
jgi:hypothetical protein